MAKLIVKKKDGRVLQAEAKLTVLEHCNKTGRTVATTKVRWAQFTEVLKPLNTAN